MIKEIEGTVVLEGPLGVTITEPQNCKVSWLTRDDGSWEIRFLTPHHLTVPLDHENGVWLRFDDVDGVPLIRQHQGITDVVSIIAQRSHQN